MGRPQTITLSESTTTAVASVRIRRAADVMVAGLLLILAAPLIATVALLVRVTSHGPVLARYPLAARRGRRADLLTFRTLVDGGGTEAHARLRAVVGADGQKAYSPVGKALTKLRLHRLPRLVNVLRGDISLFS